MPVLYLLEQGAKLHKDSELFTVTKGEEILQEIHAVEVEQIIIFGNITLTTPVINYVLQKGIDCVFCNSYGKYHGRLISTESKFGQLRLSQVKTILQPEKKLAIAKDIVRGKIQNQRTLIMRYRRENEILLLDETIQSLDAMLAKIDACTDTAALNGIEGTASASYYRSFREVLKQDLGFAARIRRPPTDPVNSMLSFCYTVLAYNIQSAISIVGMDPFLGFLHSAEPSRPSLALDLMEEFRPIIVDSLVLWLINTNVITKDDFDPAEEGKMVKIKQDSIKKIIHHYEQKVLSKIFHSRANGQTSYRHCFELQARELASVVLGKAENYRPFLVR